MGIKDFLPNYFGGDTFYFGFNSFAFSSEHIVFDAAGLLFACAMRYTDSYIAADYTPSLLAFQRQLVYLNNTLRWNMVVVFDGSDSPLKGYERARRDRPVSTCVDATAPVEASVAPAMRVRNTPIYIALAAKICRDSYINYVVAPEEADPQCSFAMFVRDDDFLPTLVVTADSDLIAYGNTKVMVVASWSEEKFRLYNFEVSYLSEKLALDEIGNEVIAETTMHYIKFGPSLFHWHAACLGCDFTENASGIPGVGLKTFHKCMKRLFDEVIDSVKDVSLIRTHFAKILNEVTSTTDLVDNQTVASLSSYLLQIEKCFTTLPTIYTHGYKPVQIGNLTNELCGDAALFFCEKHAQGFINPRTGLDFSESDGVLLDNYVVFNALHRSLTEREKIVDFGLPTGRATIEFCTIPEL
jgi:5'-3' exonuclease